MRRISAKHNGFSLLATLIGMLIVLATGISVITIVSNLDEITTQTTEHNSAENMAQLGIQNELIILKDDDNWSDNTTDSTGSHLGGSYVVSKSDNATHNVGLSSVGTFKGSEYTITRNVERPSTQARPLYFVTANIVTGLSGFPIKTEVQKLQLINPDIHKIWVQKAVIIWKEEGSILIEEVEMAGGKQWKYDGTAGSPAGRQASNTLLTLDGFLSIGPAVTDITLKFNGDVTGRDYTVILYMSDGSTVQGDFTIPVPTYASYLNIDVSTAYHPSTIHVYNILLGNHGPIPITFKEFKPTWTDRPSANILRVYYEFAYPLWDQAGVGSPLGPQPSGTTLNVSTATTTIFPGTTRNVVMSFQDFIKYRKYWINIEMSDNSTKNALIDLTFDQANFMTIGDAEADSNGTELSGFSFQNTHPDGYIWLNQIKTDLTPNSGQTISSIFINGNQVFTGPGAIGATLNIISTTINTSSSPVTMTFSTLPLETVTANLTFIMDDDTITSGVVVVPTIPKLTIVTPDAKLSYERVVLSGINFINNSGENITITKAKLNWTPDPYTSRTQRIKIGGSNQLGYNALNGTDITLLTPVTITNGQNVDFEWELNNVMASTSTPPGTDYTFTLTHSTGTTQNFTVHLNPFSSTYYYAGHTFEDNNLGGGNGFTGNWIQASGITDISSNSLRRYSGRYSMRIRNSSNTTVCRSVSYHNPPKVKFRLYVRNRWDNPDQANLAVKNGACLSGCTGTYTPVETYTILTNLVEEAYVSFNYNLSTYGITGPFCFKFQNNSAGGGEHLFVDDLYFYK